MLHWGHLTLRRILWIQNVRPEPKIAQAPDSIRDVEVLEGKTIQNDNLAPSEKWKQWHPKQVSKYLRDTNLTKPCFGKKKLPQRSHSTKNHAEFVDPLQESAKIKVLAAGKRVAATILLSSQNRFVFWDTIHVFFGHPDFKSKSRSLPNIFQEMFGRFGTLKADDIKQKTFTDIPNITPPGMATEMHLLSGYGRSTSRPEQSSQ